MKKIIVLLLTAMLSAAAILPLAAAPAPVLAAGRADVVAATFHRWEEFGVISKMESLEGAALPAPMDSSPNK